MATDHNPYVFRNGVRSSEMFFGREHELHEMVAFIRGSQSISIIGPRKIGKTTLLLALMRPPTWAPLGLGDDNLFVYLDCEVLGDATHEEIFGQFASEMAGTLDDRDLPPEPALDAAINNPGRMSFENAVRKLNRRGLRVVLVLDEFERLSSNSRLDINFFNALRSAAGRYQLVFITASARPLIELTYSPEQAQSILSSPFFNIFAPLFLGLLPINEATELIHTPAERAKRPLSPALGAFIYELVGGHPLALQVACFHAIEAPADQTDEALKIQIEQRTTRELQAHFQYYWQNLTPLEQDSLRNISEVVRRASTDTTLRGVLRDLVQKCLIVFDGPAYRYPSHAWSQFVSAQEPITETQLGAMRPTVVSSSRSGSMVLAGATLGAYQVIELIGRGGMAEVYRGHHPRLDRTVAIKVLPASLAADSTFRARFEREARAVASLRHPHIVQVFDFGDTGGMWYMVMEYVAGNDLSKRIREAGALSLNQTRLIMRDIADALDYAHAQGIVHRDVKPSNVMLQPITTVGERDFSAVLTDFGIARLVTGQSGATQTGMMMGTLDYMAPEQINAARDVDGRADIYSLGVMAFQMLTGKLPFTGNSPGVVMMGHLNQPPPDPRSLDPTIPEGTAQAILRAMAKVPGERFATAGAFAREL